jgi:DNA repair photolyase
MPWYKPQPCRPRPEIIEALQKHVAKNPGDGRDVLLCFSCDPYPIGIDNSVTSKALDILMSNGYFPNVLTKNPYAAFRDAENIWKIGTTFTSIKYVKEWEPGAPAVTARMEALKEFPVSMDNLLNRIWVSLEPVLSMDVLDVVEELKNIVDFWNIGKLNYVQGPEEIDWPKFRREIERLLPGGNFMFKKDTEQLTR